MTSPAVPSAGTEPTVTSPCNDGTPRQVSWFLSIFEQHKNRVIELPEEGEVVVGRGGPACQVNLDALDVSREHARLFAKRSSLHIADLESHNGTYLNGRRLPIGAFSLSHCDELRIGNTKILVARVLRPLSVAPQPPQSSTLHQLLSRSIRSIHDELRSAADSLQSVSLLCALVPSADVGQSVAESLRLLLRPDDLWATEHGSVTAVLPRRESEAAQALASALLQHGGAVMATVQVGFAVFPHHAADAEGLLAAAREAARSAPAGSVRSAASLTTELALGKEHVLVGDPAMRETYDLIRRLAPSDMNVLIAGESGTGKELAAQAMHAWSGRAGKPFLAINCGAMATSLLESELFGHVRGAFSGAVANRPGLLETANGGTVLLDEIGEMPTEMQVKLLRAIETERIRRVGASEERPINVRFLAATHRDLEKEVEQGRFRLDLYYRLAGGSVVLPPLRERPIELAALAQRMLNQGRAQRQVGPMTLSTEALLLLRAYAWPGNVRELRNVMVRAAFLASSDECELQDCHLPERIREQTLPSPHLAAAIDDTCIDTGQPTLFRPLKEELRELERRRISEALVASGGDKAEAARLLQMPLRTLYARCKSWGLPR